MSAWDRLPQDYRDLCGEIAKKSHIKSPQNRRVRQAADDYLARVKAQAR